jgi:hypothetical protein
MNGQSILKLANVFYGDGYKDMETAFRTWLSDDYCGLGALLSICDRRGFHGSCSMERL